MNELPRVDAVTIGFGWTAAIIANELTKAGINVVSLERGEFRDTDPDFMIPNVHDELAYAVRYKLFQDASKETLTFRNNLKQNALPIRQWGSFLPGDGVGGAGVHWNGTTYRFDEWDFNVRSRTAERYGAAFLGEDCTSQDWGVSYADLEPYYDRFEKTAGVGGKAGNLRGKKIAGGNPFEGPRTGEYPNPPMKQNFSGSLWRKAANELGYHPYPMPSANVTQAYTNPDGVELGFCVYCGFCERFACEMRAKSSPQTTLLPVLRKNPKFELRTHAHVTKINLDSTGKKAVSVTYIDAQGRELVQPADMIFITSFAFNNVRMMLVSKIGKPYDPVSGKGVVGRNYAYQMNTNGVYFFDSGKIFNTFMGAGSMGVTFDDFNGDNFDHAPYGFVGGATIQQNTTGARPIQFHPVPKGTPRWGAGWKKAVAKYYNRAFTGNAQGGCQSYRGNYLDLDPTYTDIYGMPLLRMTFDFGEHEHKQTQFMAGIMAKMGKQLGASHVIAEPRTGPYTSTVYQTTHNVGGAVIGSDPHTSALNTYGQSWDVSNVFVTGASSFPQNAGRNPTGTVGALAYRTAEAVVQKYAKHPGALVG